MHLYSANITQMVQLIETLRTQNSQIDEDPTLLDRYFTYDSTKPGSVPPRQDIVKQDVMDAHDAIVQIIFTYDSGAPTQKSKLFKMLP